MIIAIDGPSASGKGTLAKRLAAHYGLRHLDTGALYRGVALALLRAGLAPEPEAAEAAARALDLTSLDDPGLRTPEAGRVASVVAAMPGVRAALLEAQRTFCLASGAVLDGRDIGTVIAPDAPVKFFVFASPEVRAQRRLEEHHARGESVSFMEVLHDLAARDARDEARAQAPLRPAADAHLLDTSALSIEQVLEVACGIVDAAYSARGG